MNVSSASETTDNDARHRQFIARHEAAVRPLETESWHRWWEANITGSDEAFHEKEQIEIRLNLLLANRRVRRAQGDPCPAHRRQAVGPADRGALSAILGPADRSGADRGRRRCPTPWRRPTTFFARADGKELTENNVRDVLRKSTDSARRRAVWEASKAVGPIIEPNLKKLARLRNRAAGQLGFEDFHVMQLALRSSTRNRCSSCSTSSTR